MRASLRTAVKVAPARPARPRATTTLRALPSIVRAMDDPHLFSHPSLEPPFTGPSWDNWKTVLKAGDGLRMSAAETEFFKSVTGGREPPTKRVRELWWVVGRRGGKDSVASVVAAHVAATFNSPAPAARGRARLGRLHRRDPRAGADHAALHQSLLRSRADAGRHGRGRIQTGRLLPLEQGRHHRRHEQLQGRARPSDPARDLRRVRLLQYRRGVRQA